VPTPDPEGNEDNNQGEAFTHETGYSVVILFGRRARINEGGKSVNQILSLKRMSTGILLLMALAVIVCASSAYATDERGLQPGFAGWEQGLKLASDEPAKAAPVEGGAKFLVERIEIDGNSVIGSDELHTVTDPWRGKELTLAELKGVAQAVQNYYRKKGYFLARAVVPPQEIKGGMVKIQVLEGRVGDVRIEGNKFYDATFIRKRLGPALKDGVLKEDTLQRALLLLNELPDLKTKVALVKGKREGTTDLVVKVEDKNPIHVGLDYNNFGNVYTGENRYGLDLTLGNVPAQGHSLFGRIVYSSPSPSTTPFVQAAYSMPVNKVGTKIALSYANAEAKVGKEYQVLDIRGTAQIYSLSASHPLRRTERDSSNVYFSFSSKSLRNYFLNTIVSSNDEIRSVTLGYNADWFSGYGRNFLNLSATQGLGTAFGGMRNNDPLASRFHASNNFFRFNVDVSRVQKIGSRNFLILRGSGQLASNPLVVAEQFYLGGADSVRGYMQSEYLGDGGINVSAEFRTPLTKENNLQGALFVDYGSASLKEPQAGDLPSRSLFGAGAGIRYSFTDNAWLRFDAGWPLSPSTNSQNRNPALYGQFQVRF
jgi:hemolysin activation/secretion protein